jgi:peptidoglycan hydrolase-like protein with peptidoglycan-binding domain
MEAALRGFQKNCGLTQTGRADDQTRQTLKQKHGC